MPPRIPTGRSARGGHDELFDSAKAEVRASEVIIDFIFIYFFFDMYVCCVKRKQGKNKRRERGRIE